MIVLNGKYFHDQKGESSWDSPEPCSGTYKVKKFEVELYDLSKNKIGCITAKGVLCSARLQADGKYWYSYMNPLVLGKYEYGLMVEEVGRVVKGLLTSKEARLMYENSWKELIDAMNEELGVKRLHYATKGRM